MWSTTGAPRQQGDADAALGGDHEDRRLSLGTGCRLHPAEGAALERADVFEVST